MRFGAQEEMLPLPAASGLRDGEQSVPCLRKPARPDLEVCRCYRDYIISVVGNVQRRNGALRFLGRHETLPFGVELLDGGLGCRAFGS
jgi:hypothetical protein